MRASRWPKVFIEAASAVELKVPVKDWPSFGECRGFVVSFSLRREIPSFLTNSLLLSFGHDPFEGYIGRGQRRHHGYMIGEYIIERSAIPAQWDEEQYTPARPGHWTAIIQDVCDDEKSHTSEHILRSEMLACLLLLRRQMNNYFGWQLERMFRGWELDVKDGPVKVSSTGIILL